MSRVLFVAGFVVAAVCLVVGSILIAKSMNKDDCNEAQRKKRQQDFCSYSDEANRIGLDEFLRKVQSTYYKLHPEMLVFKEGITASDMKQKYTPYDPSPATIKLQTDSAHNLLKQLQSMSVQHNKLKPRERKALSQLEFYLRHVFAMTYDGNYYTGDWLMGPDLFCYKPICLTAYTFSVSIPFFRPSNVADMETLQRMLLQTGQTFNQYVENLKNGVSAGLVGAKETCEAGRDTIRTLFPNVMQKGENGIFEEHYTEYLLSPEFLALLRKNPDELQLWKETAGKNASDSIREFALEYLGKPIRNFTRYIEREYTSHCVSSNVSSGLASLPLPYVYVNDTPDLSQPTSRKLPNGDPLNGTQMYKAMMPYFTTNDMSPEEVHWLGFEMLHKLYPEALNIAREVTNEADNETAKQQFTALLTNSSMYFNTRSIPKNESGQTAHNLCQTIEAAKLYCPVRWEAISNWFYEARQVMSLLESKITNFFYFTGENNTAPNCPVTMVPDFNPSSGAQSYMRSDSSCSAPARYNIPFFLERPGPLYEEWSVNAHEARPGHHIQDQGTEEHFLDPCAGVIGWLDTESQDSYTAFIEGWALYAEYPLIARETNLYVNEPLQKYGMLKWQIWRALRLIVDTGLHYKGWSRDKALSMFAEYAWDKGDTARKEVTRYQSDPAQATAYMVGQLHIIKLREYAERELGSKFNLKDFHYQLLSQGTAPLSHLENHVRKFVSCVKNKEESGCEYVLGNKVPQASEPRSSMRRTVAKPRRVYYI